MLSLKRRREPAISTLVGGNTRVHGDLEFSGGCLIDGYVKGNVKSVKDENSTLSISERGCVEGAVMVPNVLLNGTVKGDVKAVKRVELGSNARVVGNVQYNLIEMAIGAEVNGKLIHESEVIVAGAEAEESEAVVSVAPARDEPAQPWDEPAQPRDELAGVAKVNVVGE